MARTNAPGERARRAECRAPVARRGARQHHPRLLRGAAARAPGRGARRSAVHVLTESQAQRLFDHAFGGGSRSSSRIRPKACGARCGARSGRATAMTGATRRRSIACAAPRGTSPSWRDFTGAWTRRTFDRIDGDIDRLVEALHAVRRAHRRAVLCEGSRVSRHRARRGTSRRRSGVHQDSPDYDGWEARSSISPAIATFRRCATAAARLQARRHATARCSTRTRR